MNVKFKQSLIPPTQQHHLADGETSNSSAAMDDMKKAHALKSNNPVILSNYAYALFKLGAATNSMMNVEEAVDMFKSAMQQFPKSAVVYATYGHVSRAGCTLFVYFYLFLFVCVVVVLLVCYIHAMHGPVYVTGCTELLVVFVFVFMLHVCLFMLHVCLFMLHVCLFTKCSYKYDCVVCVVAVVFVLVCINTVSRSLQRSSPSLWCVHFEM